LNAYLLLCVMAVTCIFILFSDTVSEKYLNLQFSQFGNITHVTVDRERGHALIYFEQVHIYFHNQAIFYMSLECSCCVNYVLE
jgi:hypothetical protein